MHPVCYLLEEEGFQETTSYEGLSEGRVSVGLFDFEGEPDRYVPRLDDSCPDCESSSHDVEHLFRCPQHPTTHPSEDLWSYSVGVVQFLTTDDGLLISLNKKSYQAVSQADRGYFLNKERMWLFKELSSHHVST